MSSLYEYRQDQLAKLRKIQDSGVDPYPAASYRDSKVADLLANFDSMTGRGTSVAGRLLTIREHGKIVFFDLADDSGQIQLIIRQDKLANRDDQIKFEDLNLLTRGDFISARGEVGLSQRNEKSLFVTEFKLLTKVLRPLPEKLTDIETKRKRPYLNMAINPQVRQRFQRRSVFWQTTRELLNKAGFLEINIPVLEHTTGGADSNPFQTHMDALDEDFYLRISHELPLKKLLGAGFEKIYDIGPRFRNENYSDEHLPEHVAMEWYWAYSDWQAGMEFSEKMLLELVKKTFQKTKFKLADHEVDFAAGWQRIDYAETIQQHYQIDVFKTDLQTVGKVLQQHKLEVQKTDNLASCIDKLFKNIRSQIAGCCWLVNIPTFLSPLAKQDPQDPRKTQRFQAIIAGTEVFNGFSELNDPQEQLKRMRQQQALRDQGNPEAHMLDIDFIEMLEYGMPPACGGAFSERLFWVLEGVVARDGVPFPHLKHQIGETTKSIYPDIFS